MSDNPVVEAIRDLQVRLARGENPSATFHPDNFGPMDDEELAWTRYFIERED